MPENFGFGLWLAQKCSAAKTNFLHGG